MLQARLAETHARAARLYLQRQQMEQRRQEIAAAIVQCEQAMLRTDGEVTLLEQLIADEQAAREKALTGEKGGGDGV